MASNESLGSGEFEAVKQRFTTFVESHSVESTSGLTGAIRDGKYALNVRLQLVPVNRATFSQFYIGEPTESPTPDSIAWAITLSDGETERYGIQCSNGDFREYDENSGVSSAVSDPAKVALFLSMLEEIDSPGALNPIS